ncbi:MAG: hypothetical protein ACQEWV_28410 [Bacillota bacterium]
MRKVITVILFYLWYFFLYLLVAGLIAGMVAYFFPLAGLITFGILLLGVFSASKDKTQEQMGSFNQKQVKKQLRKQFKSKELTEFDKAVKQFSRQMY